MKTVRSRVSSMKRMSWLTVPEDLHVFFVGGTEQGALDFMVQLNGQGDSSTPSFFDALKEKYGRVPESINPFEEVRHYYLRFNAFFIKIKEQFADQVLLAQLAGILRNTIPAGSTFFLLLETRVFTDSYDLGNVQETVEPFLLVEIEEEYDTFVDRVIVASQV
jgi:hypothetical protein